MKNLNTEGGIGILGGTFDPVHKAHIELANASFSKACLSKIVFLPAYQAALRQKATETSPIDRLNMLEIALEDFAYPFDISKLEIFSKKVCYSVDSAMKLKLEYPDKNLFWIIGGDHLAKLKYWKNIDLLCENVSFICALRPNCRVSDAEIPSRARIVYIDFPPLPYSGTNIRESLAAGKNSKKAPEGLSQKVYNYILEKNLYS